ncbi:MAG: EamA family transporter [Oscillospiraceae bacterium]|nr:EamA family transporter [Oscillospiraceae bacterium]
MIYLLLAIASSALVSIIMRLSTDRVKGNVSMLAMNYLMCVGVSAVYTGLGELLPKSPALPQTLGMGLIHGALYLGSFLLLQLNVKRNGVVLSATFMKLGLLVPMVLSIAVFGEMPGVSQIVGFLIAIAAIVLMNMEKDSTLMQFKSGLILLLIGGGAGDAMSKVFEELGDRNLSDQFLFYTFVAAFVLCIALMLYQKQIPGGAEIFWGFLIGIPNFFSAKFLLRSLMDVPAVVAYPTYSVATMLVITLAGVLLFRERLGKCQWGALGMILVALGLLNL